ncbi:MAG: class II glutamine amidotransferase [Gammaproteobacteria bacterium]|nr:class II glutamine amidotransferase [Gammaproteobacteria bacterium]
MCELFALSSRRPTAARFTLQRFAARGGLTGHNVDGWGLAIYDGAELRLYREPEPARDSTWLQFVQRRHLPTRLLVSHIRRATHGAVSLANTQPYAREIAGRMHCFAHNGQLEPLLHPGTPQPHRFHPIGETDSERAACLLFDAVARLWERDLPPPVAERRWVVEQFAATMRRLGPANFLYADGECLFAHGHRRIQSDRRIAPPGLWLLQRECAVDRDGLPEAGVNLDAPPGPQAVALLASVPLTEENWRPLGEGELLLIEAGSVENP